MESITEDEWIQPVEEGYEFRINNGKVVVMDFRVYEGRAQFKMNAKSENES